MGNINPAYFDRVRYILYHDKYGRSVIPEPIGWRTDEKEYSRNLKYSGVIAKFSNNLTFIGTAKDYLLQIDEMEGIEAKVTLTREERNHQTDFWEESYTGELDMSTIKEKESQVSLKFNSGGLHQILKSKESEKVEIERLTTLDGRPISELSTERVELDGKRIFLSSTMYVPTTDNTATMRNSTNGNTRGMTVGVPLKVKNRSHEHLKSVLPNTTIGDNSHERNAKGNVGNMFFYNADRERKLKIKINLVFDINYHLDDTRWAEYKVLLSSYQNGASLDFKKHEDEMLYLNKAGIIERGPFELTYEGEITLNEGESLALHFNQLMDGQNGHNAIMQTTAYDIECDITIEEDSEFKSTKSEVILAHELGSRLAHIITGSTENFHSEVSGRKEIGYKEDGEASYLGMAHGFWLRQFTGRDRTEQNKYKGFATSFRDYFDSLDAVWNLGMGIEMYRGKERIRVEKESYFYQNVVTIRLPNEVSNYQRTRAKEYCYSSIDIGYAKGWENEEAMGLDEYNAKTTFQTCITRVSKSYTKISKYLAGVYPMEFARRKPQKDYPTEDHRYDKEIFLLDMKKVKPDVYSLRKWQDDFSEKPKGVFSPETASNLRLSPINILKRHGDVISPCLDKYPEKYISYGSSEGNSKLVTKMKQNNEHAENGRILNSELNRPLYTPDWVEFEHVVDSRIMKQIEGTTLVQGKQVPNFYGLVEYKRKGKYERGFLFNCKPNGKGKWKLLKAYK
ncbi:hypothetical protein ACFSTE_15760 [Aquimarina hainanensis]|uniref:Uncharacterized protein n=2 Tax=Aquimarina hainanensis TaxID=1578017 RepID=A0ABW5NBC7_9FLAO